MGKATKKKGHLQESIKLTSLFLNLSLWMVHYCLHLPLPTPRPEKKKKKKKMTDKKKKKHGIHAAVILPEYCTSLPSLPQIIVPGLKTTQRQLAGLVTAEVRAFEPPRGRPWAVWWRRDA